MRRIGTFIVNILKRGIDCGIAVVVIGFIICEALLFGYGIADRRLNDIYADPNEES